MKKYVLVSVGTGLVVFDTDDYELAFEVKKERTAATHDVYVVVDKDTMDYYSYKGKIDGVWSGKLSTK